MKSISHRIKLIADNEGIKITQMEARIGASKGVLSRSIANNTDIQSKWVTMIVENYPLYNSEWILTGKGEMLKSNINNHEIQNDRPSQSECPICAEKDKRIEQLERQLNRNETEIDRLWDLIECPPGQVKSKQRSA